MTGTIPTKDNRLGEIYRLLSTESWLTTAGVARKMNATQASVTSFVSKLYYGGYIERRKNASLRLEYRRYHEKHPAPVPSGRKRQGSHRRSPLRLRFQRFLKQHVDRTFTLGTLNSNLQCRSERERGNLSVLVAEAVLEGRVSKDTEKAGTIFYKIAASKETPDPTYWSHMDLKLPEEVYTALINKAVPIGETPMGLVQRLVEQYIGGTLTPSEETRYGEYRAALQLITEVVTQIKDLD